MSAIPVAYPSSPKNISEEVIQPSPAFKKEVSKVLSSIVFFMIVYFALMTAAIGLAALCGYGGVMLIIALPKFITLMIGLGLIGLGGMVIYFLLKFLFKSKVTDRSHLTQITEQEQPELFAFIRTLTQETQSPFPKKIYLSHDVNACVFYDSSFWSMFFPVRKNLQIGLGLVNAVNLSEFKAILAHEFGHFSQRSMKLGSYVYNVNQVIFNMLYDNDGYGRTLQGWANISGYFAFFASITVKIVEGIQWVLQQVYSVVNKNYMSLSRQMEFHADSVAAYVSGGDHLITSLRRLDVANSCFNQVFETYNAWYKQNLKPENIYPQHSEVMKHFASDHGLPVEHGLPHVTAASFAKFNKSRLVIKDQWASHPSTDDREDHLRKLDIHTDTVTDPAWVVFRNAEALQKEMTEKIYSEVTYKGTTENVNALSFRERYWNEVEKFSLDKRYKGFYNNRSIASFESFEVSRMLESSPKELHEVLDDSTLELPYRVEGLLADISALEQIRDGAIPVKTFDFDGKKYTSGDVAALIATLREELAEAEAQLRQADRNVIAFFLRRADNAGQQERSVSKYEELFTSTKETEEDLKLYQDLITTIQPLYHGQISIEEASGIISLIRLKEVPIKTRLERFLADSKYAPYMVDADIVKLKEYTSKDLQYFTNSTFLEAQFALFNESIHMFRAISSERSFTLKKEILDWQLQFVN